MWHLEGMFELDSTTNPGNAGRTTHVTFGAGGWYHLHRGASSDFSLGVALAVDNTAPPAGGSQTLTSVEPGAMARAFVTPNVAVHGRLGIAMVLGDTNGGGTDFHLLGEPVIAFGFTYFFR